MTRHLVMDISRNSILTISGLHFGMEFVQAKRIVNVNEQKHNEQQQ